MYKKLTVANIQNLPCLPFNKNASPIKSIEKPKYHLIKFSASSKFKMNNGSIKGNAFLYSFIKKQPAVIKIKLRRATNIW